AVMTEAHRIAGSSVTVPRASSSLRESCHSGVPALSLSSVDERMIRTTRLALLLAAALVLEADVRTQPPGPAAAMVDVTQLGPQVGDTVPDFRLTDQRGQPRTLATLMGPNGHILVFNRSADW